MMEGYLVKITPQAQAQIREIVQYLAFARKEPDTAQRMMNALQTEIDSLSLFPGHAALTEELPWRDMGIHRIPVKNYLICYWIDEDIHVVHILAVVYGRRDQRKALSEIEINES